MSQWFDGIRHNIRQHLSKVYKDAKAKAPPEEFKEFESWFWKIRPHLNVDWTLYNPGANSETSGPAINNTKSTDDLVSTPIQGNTEDQEKL